MHNFIITRNLNAAGFQHERTPGWAEHIVLGIPSEADGDPLGEALEDPRFETEPVGPDDIPETQSSALGTSLRRQAMLTQCTRWGLVRPAYSRQRASDAQLPL